MRWDLAKLMQENSETARYIFKIKYILLFKGIIFNRGDT